MLRLVWRESARSELRQIVSYIAERTVRAADRLQPALEGCAERLVLFPFMYRPGRVASTREAVVHPNYLLIHRVGTDLVEILGGVHARQEYPGN